jgi:hypothetical protein
MFCVIGETTAGQIWKRERDKLLKTLYVSSEYEYAGNCLISWFSDQFDTVGKLGGFSRLDLLG